VIDVWSRCTDDLKKSSDESMVIINEIESW